MIKKIAAIGIAAVGILSFVGAAAATGFYAAPMNSGPPTDLPGQSFPIIHETLGIANAITSPIVQPILAPGGGATAPAPEPMMHHHHHHHHHMMKHHM